SSSLTGLLVAAVPLVGAVVVTLTGTRERQGTRRWVGLLVGLAGVTALVGFDIGQASAISVTEVFIVAVCYALGPIIPARSMAGGPARGFVAVSPALTALIYLPFAIRSWPSSMPTAHVIESVVGLGVICTAVAFLVFFALIREVGPVRATVIT